MNSIVLASASNARRLIFETMGIPFVIDPASIDEQAIRHPDHGEQARLIAAAKGELVAVRHPEALVIAADTFTVLNGETLEKPADLEEARDMLRRQSGQKFHVYTGYWFKDGKTGRVRSTVVKVGVKMRSLRPSEIERYVSTYPVCNYAAAHSESMIEGQAFIETLEGSAMGCFYGLPLELVSEDLQISGMSW